MFFREEPLLNATFQKDSKNRTRTSIGHQKAMKTGINANEFEEIETDKDFFNYNLAVGLAISKSLGSKVFVRHQSGNIVYEAYYNGSFCGYFTVYSDYVSYHSIDNHIYTNLLKDIA